MRAWIVFLDSLQQPVTPEMMVGCQGVLRFTQTLRRGYVAEANVVIKNPGLSLLTRSTYLAVLTSLDGTKANAKVIARARISGAPESGSGPTVTLPLVCAPASHPQDLRAVANASIQGAGIPPYTIKVVPTPDPPGSIAVALASSPGAAWSVLRGRALRAQAVFQEDVVRSPFRFVAWKVLDVVNARLIVTLDDSAALRASLAQSRYLHLSISGTANPGDATQTYVVGRVMGYSSVLGNRVDVECNLADPSILPGVGAYVPPEDYTAAALPTFDPLFEQGSDDIPTSALQGRTATWNTDPVTHAITLDDWTTSARVVNLGSGGFSPEVSYQAAPVKHVKARLVCEWQQTAVGIVDLAPLIALANSSTGGRLLSLTFGTVEGPGGPATDFASTAGWSQDATRQRPSYSVSDTFWSGRTIRVTYRLDTVVSIPNANGGFDIVSQAGTPYTQDHAENWSMNIRGVSWLWFYASYSYVQTRRETVDLVLDVDTQTTTLGGDTLDLGPVTLGDILVLPGISPFVPGTVYNRGDRVMFAGEAFECLNDNTLFFFRSTGKYNAQRYIPNAASAGVLPGPHPDWKSLGSCAPLKDKRLPSYFDTARGRGSIAHMLLRMRAVALKRLQHILVSKTFRWEDAATIDLVDRCRMVIRDGDATKVMVGKVQTVERVLDGRKGGTIRVTIAVSLGTGRHDNAGGTAVDGTYGGVGYFPPSYHQTSTPAWLADQYVTDGASVYRTGTDVEWSINQDPLLVPVDAMRLHDPYYSCLECSVRNTAATQLALMQARGASGGDPREVVKEAPTTLRLAMRPLITEGSLQRAARVHAQLTTSTRGAMLTGDGEP